nr:MlaD family protein [Mesobacterium pallidum]
MIHIEFDNGDGIAAEETELRYRDIEVGRVEEVGFSEGLERVRVGVRLDKEFAEYVDDESRFWIVRPEVTASGVTGLDTVLSGVYIEGVWDNTIGPPRTEFEGQSTAPLLGAGETGRAFKLVSPEQLPTARTPILYKGVKVGVVGAAEVTEDGMSVRADAVIYEPFDRLVDSSTRFWDISGFDFSIGANGARLNFTSVASLIQGGVTFETLGSGGTPLAEDAVFELFDSEDAARDDFLVEGEGQAIDVSMVFDQNLNGLSAGAAIELGGLRVGEVISLTGLVDPERFGDNRVRLLVSARINPGRVGLPGDTGPEAFFDYLDERIEGGLRARLTNASILTGGLKVQLVDVVDAEPATLQRDARPYARIPTADPNIADVTATAQGVMQRISDLPIEEVMQSAIDLMDQTTALIGSEGLQAAPDELLATLEAIRQVATSEGVAGLPEQLAGLMTELQATAGQVSTILTELQDGGTPATIIAALEDLAETANRLPALIDSTDGVMASAQEVMGNIDGLVGSADGVMQSADETLGNVDQVLTGADGVVASIRGIADSEEFRALPGQVGALTTQLNDTVAKLDAIVQDLVTRDAVGTLTTALEDLARATEDLPGVIESAGEAADGAVAVVDSANALVEDARGIVSQAGQLPLDELSARVDSLLAAAERLIDQESTRELPGAFNAALTELRETLETLRNGGLIENANATLASARDAADAIADASRNLPALSDDLRRVARQANTTLAGFDPNSVIAREAGNAIRQIQDAAQAIERLARTLERNPNSLIIGR